MNAGDLDSLLDWLPLPGWGQALVALALSAALAWLVRVVLEKVATRLAGEKGTTTHAVDVLVDALRKPVTLLLFLVGVEVALRLAELPPRYETVPLHVIIVLIILVASWAIGAGLLALLRKFAPLSSRLAPLSGFLTGLIRGVVAALGLLAALHAVGVSITPVLASLGVGSVAVALALQETLGNLFAGIAILADHPIRVGEWIRIEPDLEGKVVGIGWRATTLVDLANNLVVLPNGTVARSIIRNFDRPGATENLPVKIVVEHGTPVEAALSAMREAVEPLGGSVLVTAIDPAGIELTATIPVESRGERAAARSRVLEAIAASMARAGVSAARAAGPLPAAPKS